MESKFKIGDMVVGVHDSHYAITNHKAIMKVVKVLIEGRIKVEIIEQSEFPKEIGETYIVEEKYFKLINPTFKVGDIIVGTSDTRYAVTNHKATMRVTRILEGHHIKDIAVEIIEHTGDTFYIGGGYTVESKYFKLVEKVEPVKPWEINLVFVKYDTDKKYLFLVPEGVTLSQGDMVYTNTIRGEGAAECVSNSFIVGKEAYRAILEGQGIGWEVEMKYILGRAVQEVSYVIADF